MDQKKQNIRIRAIKAKYYTKIKSLFDKSLGDTGTVDDKIDDIEECIKECEKELLEYKRGNMVQYIQTYENFLNNKE